MKKYLFLSLLIHLMIIAWRFAPADKNEQPSKPEVITIDFNQEMSLPTQISKDQSLKLNAITPDELTDPETIGVRANTIISPTDDGDPSDNSDFFYGIGVRFGGRVYVNYQDQRISGLVITEIFQEYGAFDAKLRVGDIVLKINDRQLNGITSLQAYYNKPIKILFLRDSQFFTSMVRVTKVRVSRGE